MKTKTIESNSAVEALPKLVELLSALPAAERDKAISAARILLADSTSSSISATHKEAPIEANREFIEGIAPRAAGWLRKNHLGREQLDQIFSIEDNTFDVIAAKMPGKSKRQQTVEAYIICGIKSFL